jgi:hypothetical protein
VAAVALFGALTAAGCGHSSSSLVERDRPAPPPADAVEQIQNSAKLSPEQKQLAINAITAARTRASGQMAVGPKRGAGM